MNIRFTQLTPATSNFLRQIGFILNATGSEQVSGQLPRGWTIINGTAPLNFLVDPEGAYRAELYNMVSHDQDPIYIVQIRIPFLLVERGDCVLVYHCGKTNALPLHIRTELNISAAKHFLNMRYKAWHLGLDYWHQTVQPELD